MSVKDVKVWKKMSNGKKDARIYVHADDGREGCRYLTGNGWNTKGSQEGKLTDEEWAEARELAFYDGCWHTVYVNEIRHSHGPEEDTRKEIEELRKLHDNPHRRIYHDEELNVTY